MDSSSITENNNSALEAPVQLDDTSNQHVQKDTSINSNHKSNTEEQKENNNDLEESIEAGIDEQESLDRSGNRDDVETIVEEIKNKKDDGNLETVPIKVEQDNNNEKDDSTESLSEKKISSNEDISDDEVFVNALVDHTEDGTDDPTNTVDDTDDSRENEEYLQAVDSFKDKRNESKINDKLLEESTVDPISDLISYQDKIRMERLFEEAKNEKLILETKKAQKKGKGGKKHHPKDQINDSATYKVEDDERFYALRRGLTTKRCLYFCWKDICEQIEGCPDAEYEVYDDLDLAVAYILDNEDDIQISTQKRKRSSTESVCSSKKSSKRLKASSSKKGTSVSGLTEADDLVPVYSTKKENKIIVKPIDNKLKESQFTEEQKKRDEAAAAKEQKAKDRLQKLKNETERLRKEADWEIMFAALSKYKKEVGDYNGPYSKESQLGTWVHKQKLEFKKFEAGNKSKLSTEKVNMLKAIGFQFHDRTKYLSWDDHLENYKKYLDKHGPDFQPLSDTPLGKWAYTIRQNYKRVQAGETVSNLSAERIEVLKELGFDWKRPPKVKAVAVKEKKGKEKAPKVNVKDKKWKKRYKELVEYKEEHKTAVVPLSYGPLGRWVANQRKYYKAAKRGEETKYMNEERLQLLDDIDFEVEVKRGRKSPKGLSECSEEKKKIEGIDWDAMYEQLKAFHTKHGHSVVPFRPTTKLRTWVVNQRREYKKLREGTDSFMTATRILKLNDLGFNFETKPVLTWDERFIKLIEFKKKFGHVQVPRQYEGLGKWISEQRLKYRYRQEGKSTNLTNDQIAKLNDLGMVWQVIKQPPAHQRADKKPWSVRFEELVAFKAQHGHTIVPQHYPELGSWVQVQRNHYKLMKHGRKSLMTMEKALKLADIGFVFEVKPRKKRVTKQSLANPYPNLPPVDTRFLPNVNDFVPPDETMPLGI